MNSLKPIQGQVVIMSDLDGTLLDHHDYSTTVALSSIQKLIHYNIPLIFNSSKTFEEQRILQHDLGICAPFIFENGSGVAVPAQLSPTFGADHVFGDYHIKQFAPLDLSDILTVLLGNTANNFQKLLTMSAAEINEIIQYTGLNPQQAALAKARVYTDTILQSLTEEEVVQWALLLENHEIQMTKGGRFYTLQAKNINKATPLNWLRSLWDAPLHIIAIGDGENDASMIAAADEGYWVQRPDRSWATPNPSHRAGSLIPKIGPHGFVAIIQTILKRQLAARE